MSESGLRIESAASVTARDMIQKHLSVFAHVIRTDRAANTSTVAAYIDGLAGVTTLTIVGMPTGQGKDLIIEAVITKLRDAINRDLAHLATT